MRNKAGQSVLYCAALAYNKTGRYVESNEKLDLCIKMSIQEDAHTYLAVKGDNFESMKDYKRAVKYYDTAWYIFQHPFYWYSSPALVKEWIDLVLEHGFAYGQSGRALEGKIMMNAITTGGPDEAYQKGGYNRFTIREFLAPFDQTARLCQMRYLAPFARLLLAVAYLRENDRPHARRMLEQLRDEFPENPLYAREMTRIDTGRN